MVFVIIFIGLPILGWYLFTAIFDAATSDKFKPEKPSKDTYITHIHNDNRQVHFHGTNQSEENHLDY